VQKLSFLLGKNESFLFEESAVASSPLNPPLSYHQVSILSSRLTYLHTKLKVLREDIMTSVFQLITMYSYKKTADKQLMAKRINVSPTVRTTPMFKGESAGLEHPAPSALF
jgi:hypothetical protein